MNRTFVAIDVETANPDRASICQVGAVKVDDGVIVDTWGSLVDPESDFNPWNIAIHGIVPEQVRGQPRFPEIAVALREFVGSRVLASHTAFDRVAIQRAHERYALAAPGWEWLDTACVSRRAWDDFADSGYGLREVASFCGVDFRHHDAVEDARAAAEILLHAIRDSGLDVPAWLARVRQPIRPRDPDAKNFARKGRANGPLAGELVVFTGALSIGRAEASRRAAVAGCDVGNNVTRKTTLLVVGQQDLRALGGYAKSSKQRKAEQLAEKGAEIAILSEEDFMRLVDGDSG